MQTTSLRFHIDENKLTQLINSGSTAFLDMIEAARLLNVVTVTMFHSNDCLNEEDPKYIDHLVAVLSIYDNLCDRAVRLSEDLWRRHSGKPYSRFLDFMLHGTDEQVPNQLMKLNLWPFQIATSGIAGDVMVRQLDLRGRRIIEQLNGEHVTLRTYYNLHRHREQFRSDAETLLKQFIFAAVMLVEGLAEELGFQPETLKTLKAEVIH